MPPKRAATTDEDDRAPKKLIAWTPEEIASIYKLLAAKGQLTLTAKDVTRLAESMPHRTEGSIRTMWKKSVRPELVALAAEDAKGESK